MNEQPRNGSFGGFLAGLLIGAGMLLLMAPASGRDTRRRIAQTAGKVKSGARNKWDRVRGEVGRTAADLKTAVGAGRDAYARNREARGSTVRVHPL